jgi:hypothetical protein
MTMTLFCRDAAMGDDPDGSIARCVYLEGEEGGRKGREVVGAYTLVGQQGDQLSLEWGIPYPESGLWA